MKQIGHIDGATTEQTWRTHSLGMLAPHDLFIPNPGERENIDAEAFEHVGWVNPDADGGVICGNHATVGDNGRPAYVRRPDPDRVEMQEDGTYQVLPVRIDPGTISDRDRFLRFMDQVYERGQRAAKQELRTMSQPAPTVQAEPPMSFYDSAFIAAYIDLRSADYDDITRIQRAHAIAAKLTRNRAVPT